MIHAFMVVFDTQTGRVVSSPSLSFSEDMKEGVVRAAMVPWQGGSFDFLFSDRMADSSNEYVVFREGKAEILPRPQLRVKINRMVIRSGTEEEITLSGLPQPCRMTQDPGEPEEQSVIVEGGGFVFSAENPGKYQFKIDAFPFLPLELEFTAT